MEFKSVFKKIDRDSDFVITAYDLEIYAKRFNLTPKFASNWLLIFDDDEDEVISWHDIEDCVLKYGGASSVTCQHLAKILKPRNPIYHYDGRVSGNLSEAESSDDEEDENRSRSPPIVSDIKPSYNKPFDQEENKDLSVDLPPEVIMMACDVPIKQKLELICACRAFYLRSKDLKHLSKNYFPMAGYTSIVEADESANESDTDSVFEDPVQKKTAMEDHEDVFDKMKNTAKNIRNKIYRRASSKQLEKILNLKPASPESARELELCNIATTRLTNHLQKTYGGNWKVVLDPNPGATISHHTEGLIFFKFKNTYFNYAVLIWKGYQSEEKFMTKVHNFCCCQQNYF